MAGRFMCLSEDCIVMQRKWIELMYSYAMELINAAIDDKFISKWRSRSHYRLHSRI